MGQGLSQSDGRKWYLCTINIKTFRDMARNIDPVIRPPMDLRRAITQFHKDTLEMLEIGGATQHVFPVEVYPGYKQVNERRKRQGGWHSTGRGMKSFRGTIKSADDIDDIYLTYVYARYMRFAELGVGAGTSARDVDRSKNARYDVRYISSWDRSVGRSHRPFIRREVNHLASRIERYLCLAYGRQIEAKITEGLTVDIDVQRAMRLLGVE